MSLRRIVRHLIQGCICFVITASYSSAAFAGLGASVTLVTGQPTSINPGETTQLEITLSNNNTAAAITGVAFSNLLPGTLPDGLRISGVASYNCTDPSVPSTSTGVGTLTAVDGTQTISLTGGVIPARDAGSSTDGTCTIIIPVTAGSSNGASATYNYEIVNGAVTGNDGGAVANSGAVNQSVNVLSIPLPTIDKSFGSSTLILGGNATTLTITIGNTSVVDLPNVNVTDTFPLLGGTPLIQVATPTNATTTCTGGGTPATFSPVAGGVSVSATGATVAAGETCTITVDVEARQTNGLYQTGFVNNTINGTTDFSNDLGLIPSNASAQVRTRSPLRVDKSFNNAAIASSQSDTFDVVFTNDGDASLVINSFTDSPIDGVGDLAYGLKTNGVPSMSCTGGGTPGTFARTTNDLGVTQTGNTTIAAGQSCTLTTNFTATAQTPNVPISFTNTIAEGAVGTVTPGIVSETTSASLLVSDELRVLKTVSPSNPAPGNPVQYTVEVQNWSSSAINNIETTDTFTNGQTFLTGTIGGIDFTPTLSGTGCVGLTVPSITGATSASLTIGTLPARINAFTPGSCTLTFWSMTDTTAGDGSAVSNTINAGDVCYNAGATCNGSASNTTSSSVDADTFTADKSFSPAGPLAENAISTMMFTLSNLSANPITAATLSDTLPAANSGSGQLRIATPPNAATTCSGGVITAVADSTSLTMNGATIPARASSGTGAAGTCTVQVDVIGAAGVYDNTTTIAGTQSFGDGTTDPIGPISSNTERITYTSSLSATKTFTPSSVSSGGMSTVIVRLSNGGDIALTGVNMTDPLPAGMILATPPNAQTTCAGTAVFTGNAGDSSVSVSGVEIAANGTCDVLFDVVATGAANWVNTIPAGNITADGGVENQTAVIGTLNFNAPTGITVAKATNPSTLTFPGQTSVLTVTLTNSTQAVTNLGFTDYFTIDGTSGAAANGMRISSTPNASTTCPGGVVSAMPDDTSFSLSGASLSASATCEVTVNVTSIVIGGITNFIPSGGVTTDQGLSNSGAATTSLTTQGNLGVTKKFTPNLIAPGDRSRLRITFFNPTAQPAADVSVTDNLPAGVVVPPSANPTTTCLGASVSTPTSAQVSVNGANIPAASGGVAETCYSEIDVTAAAAGDYTNTIPIGDVTGTIGGIPSQNSQPASDILYVKAPLTINKAIGGFTLDSGNPAGFTTGSASRAVGATAPLVISLTNSNTDPLTQASVTDVLPAGLVIAQTPSASTTCTNGVVNAPASSTTVTLTGATIPASGSCTFTVQVLSNITGTYVNTIAAGDVTTFEGVTNEEPTSAEIMISSPPSVAKEFSPSVIAAGGTSTMTIYLGNENDSAITLTSLFTDTLPTAPGNVLVAGTPNITKTCPGTVTASAGSGTITYANGATIPVGGCTISVDVTASTPGVHTNNISAGELQTDFGNNPDPANAELTVSTLGHISGRVFQDNNVIPNGTYEPATDSALPGISIELRSGATCSGGLLSTAITDAAGNYTFSLLSAGTYSVCQNAQPTDTTNGMTSAGTIIATNGSTGVVGTASNPTTTSSQIIAITLNNDGGSGETSGSINNNFAEIAPSTISGRVFFDENNNGIQNGADNGIDTVTIELLNSVNTVIATTTTDANGDYSFTGLLPDTYSVREPNQPANTNNGMTVAPAIDNGGTAGTPTGVGTLPSQISTIILPPNTDATGHNFAEIPYTRTIMGSVFFDYDNNATQNGVDYGIENVTLNLSGTDVNGTPVSTSTLTSTNGTYSFSSLPEGTYSITQSAQPTGTTNGTTTAGTTGGTASNPSATTSQIINIDLTGANTLSAGNDFPEIPITTPDLTIVKTHSPASFAAGSSTGIFTITPSNIGGADSTGTITITDTLPAGLTLASIPVGTDWSCSGSIGGSSFTCTTLAVISSSATGNDISFRVFTDAGATGQLLTNQAVISGGGEPPGFENNNTAMDTVGISTIATVSGTIWRDDNHDRQIDPGEELVEGWSVELVLNGTVVDTVTTAADGTYTFTNVSPGSGYEIRFREPSTGLLFGNAVTNEQGINPASGTRDTGTSTINGGTNAGNPAGADTAAGTGTLKDLLVLAGDNIIEQSLPLDPAGVVYDAVTRVPIAGAQVTISGPGGFNPATHLVSGQGTVTTGSDGFYQFLLTPTAPIGTYTLAITTYPGGYVPAPSTLIPVCTNTLTVNAVPDPALVHDEATAPDLASPIHDPATCPAATAALAPANQASTQHYFSFVLDATTSGDLVNNHIPLDPTGAGDIVIIKTSPIVSASIGQLVPYTITARNTSTNNYTALDILDTIPAGFKYVKESGSSEGVKLEPTVNGRLVTWENQTLNGGESKTYKLILVVGSGVQPGEYTNRAQVLSNPGGVTISNIATAVVRIIPDPVFDCSDIIGKVFDDANRNGYQDDGEVGIANVRVATVNGLLVTTDDYGRFHVACADIPDEERGSNFLMKLDERTLPTGYRVTTENPRAVRVTRGKMTKLNFGAAIHRVVRIDMQDNAFIPDEIDLHPQWQEQIMTLPEQLTTGPSVIRIAYQVKNEGEDLARKRLKNIVQILRDEWGDKECCHDIMIEEELVMPAVPFEKGEK
ncbi:MAG: SdrD B-like domain-containing protein [Alphaproteobacteria bacterium]